MYNNFRCRKCNNILSVQEKENSVFSRPSLGGIIKKDTPVVHPGCKIEDTEKVFADLISYSDEPLEDAKFVYRIDGQDRYFLSEVRG